MTNKRPMLGLVPIDIELRRAYMAKLKSVGILHTELVRALARYVVAQDDVKESLKFLNL